MSEGRRGKNRVQVGTLVKVPITATKHYVLQDMAIVDKEKKPLNDVWMHGKITEVFRTYYNVELPAAERTLAFCKDFVVATKEGEDPPPVHVVFDKTVKAVTGLELPSKNLPTDYYLDKKKALAVARENAKTNQEKRGNANANRYAKIV